MARGISGAQSLTSLSVIDLFLWHFFSEARTIHGIRSSGILAKPLDLDRQML
jgi:hypothetical protein